MCFNAKSLNNSLKKLWSITDIQMFFRPVISEIVITYDLGSTLIRNEGKKLNISLVILQ